MTAQRSRAALFDRVPILLRILLAVVGGYSLAAGLSLLSAHFAGGTEREMRTAVHFLFFLYYAICIVTFFSINSLKKAFVVAVVVSAAVWGIWWAMGGQTV
jgi:hypothetical protein